MSDFCTHDGPHISGIKRIEWDAPVILYSVDCCCQCGEYLSLGPSNDEPLAVWREIEAAELAQHRRLHGSHAVGWNLHFMDGDVDSVLEEVGWLARQIATHDEEHG